MQMKQYTTTFEFYFNTNNIFGSLDTVRILFHTTGTAQQNERLSWTVILDQVSQDLKLTCISSIRITTYMNIY